MRKNRLRESARVTSSVRRSTSVAAGLTESLLLRQVGVHSDLIFLSLLLYILYLFFIYSFIFIFCFYLFFFLFDPVQYIFIPVTICSCSRHVKDIAGHLASLPDRRLPQMRTILQRQFRKDLPQFLQMPAKGMLKVA